MLRILLNYSSAEVRLVLRIYFNVILAALALLGDQCCKKRSQLRLLRGQILDITQTTGWLRGPSAIYMLYTLRCSPAGWLGSVMLLASAFWLAADLMVTGFVVPTTVVDRCHFNTTSPATYMVSNSRASDYRYGPLIPTAMGTCWDVINEATITSRRNGGLTGVFRKANTDLAFRADENDILLSWQCVVSGPDSTYDNITENGLIVDDLISRDLLYGNFSLQETQYIGGAYLQLAIWSSSVGDWSGELAGLTPDEIINSPISHPWDVLAAIDLSQKSSDPRLMRPYHCFLNDTSMDFLLGKIQAKSTLLGLISVLRSNLYGYFTDNVPLTNDPGDAIVLTLNSMMMAGAAYQAGLNIPPPNIEDPTQGCLRQKALIPIAVIIVFLAVTGTVIFVFVYWITLSWLIHRTAKRNSESGREVFLEHTPNGLLGWMLQAVRDNSSNRGTTADIQANGMWLWTLRPSVDRRRLQLQRQSRDGDYGKVQQTSTLLEGPCDTCYEGRKGPSNSVEER